MEKKISTFIFALFLCVHLSSAQAMANETAAIWGEFVNDPKIPLTTAPDISDKGAATCFGGHVKETPNESDIMEEPKGGGFNLVESSSGQMVGNTVPYPDFQQVAIDHARKMLYYEYADETGDFSQDQAAFRYKALLYEVDEENRISAQFQNMSDLWTENDRVRALEASKFIQDALIHDPQHPGLRSTLLDIYYDIAVADLSKATEKRVEAQKSALGLDDYLAAPGEFQISKEISLLTEALPLYDAATKPYFDLLKDPMGIDMAWVNAAGETKPFGFYMFQQDVPLRSLYAPSYKDTNGDLSAVVDEDVLFTGYKDLVLLFRMEQAAAQAAAKLARLYALRAAPGDADEARKVIGEAQQKAYTDGSILNAIFTEDALADIDQNSGLVEAKASWAQGLSALSGVKSFLDGEANPLGLDKNFLALVQTDVPGTGDNMHKDSFDYFAGMLIPGGDENHLAGPLGNAKIKYDKAVAQYEKVQMYKDTIAGELESQRGLFGDRLRAISGAEYPDPPNPDSEYHTPEDNEGSEIYIQFRNIELANLRIKHNQQEIDNLEQQIKNEIERRGKVHGINNLIGQVYIKYGDKQARLTKKIGAIRAAQAAANEVKKGIGSAINAVKKATAIAGTIGGIGMGVISAGIIGAKAAAKYAIEMKITKLQAEKERLAAQQSAEITCLQDQILDTNSKMLIKNLLLNMHTLAIESQEAAVMLAQEMGRLQALLDERAHLEARWKAAKKELGTRYFADPSHRIIMDQYIIDADFAFQEAQFWVFVMARALDYKRNTRFTATFGGRTYTSSSVFALRNAQELVEMAIALWTYDETSNIGDRQGTQFVRFSMREDFLEYRRMDENGNPASYNDPITGEEVDAITAFHSYLRQKSVNDQEVILEFNTVRSNFGDTFFSNRRWNEKIKWISVKINADAQVSDVMVDLEQSGTAFVRNASPGTSDPDHPDRLVGEMTGYPVWYWYKDNAGDWASKDSFGFGINAVVNDDKYAPPDSYQKREFHEMSPAVTKWVLKVPLENSMGWKILDVDKISDIEIWFYNYYHARN